MRQFSKILGYAALGSLSFVSIGLPARDEEPVQNLVQARQPITTTFDNNYETD